KKVISVAEEGVSRSEGGWCSCMGCSNEVVVEGVDDEKQGSGGCRRVEQRPRRDNDGCRVAATARVLHYRGLASDR
ncbi:hypothetical protein GW17_00045376, partial [Ensete ventricosum]